MLAKQKPRDADAEALDEAAGLDAAYGHLTPEEIIELSVREHFSGDIAAVSSFGADSAVLLHMIAKIDRTLPVLFLDTGKHFEETLSYRDALVDYITAHIRAYGVRPPVPNVVAEADAIVQRRSSV